MKQVVVGMSTSENARMLFEILVRNLEAARVPLPLDIARACIVTCYDEHTRPEVRLMWRDTCGVPMSLDGIPQSQLDAAGSPLSATVYDLLLADDRF